MGFGEQEIKQDVTRVVSLVKKKKKKKKKKGGGNSTKCVQFP